MKKKVAFKTLGCKVNQYESGVLKSIFTYNGYQLIDFKEKADIYVINTCSVTGEAERKSRQMVRKAIRTNPNASILVTGCSIEANIKSFSEFDHPNYFVASNYYKGNIFHFFEQSFPFINKRSIHFLPASEIKEYGEADHMITNQHTRTRGIIKVQDGCNQFCSYCVIPYLRGRSRSRSSKEILIEANELGSSGFREIVLLGINLGSYEYTTEKENISLTDLIKKIEMINSIKRIRLSSIELPWINHDLIDLFQNSAKICHHLHIPLQSGDDDILRLMRRKYTTEKFQKKIDLIRKQIPDIAITTDLIVGFPGENDPSFERTYKFVQNIGFSKIHVFPFSERPFSLASHLSNKIDGRIIKQRVKKINQISEKMMLNFYQENLGLNKNILVECLQNQNGICNIFGLTDNYIKVNVNHSSANKGDIVKAKLIKINGLWVEGKLVAM